MKQQSEQISKLSILLLLEKNLRLAEDETELALRLVNESKMTIGYRQAVLWDAEKSRVVAVSGVPDVDANAPFVRVLTALCKDFETRFDAIQPLGAGDYDAISGAEGWREWLPPHGLWTPMKHPRYPGLGGLFMVRNDPFAQAEVTLAEHMAEAGAHAWGALRRPGRKLLGPGGWSDGKKRILLAVLLLLFLLAAFVPVRLKALGQAEVVALDPFVLRSPMDGIVADVLVEPNERVAKDQLLARLDTQDLEHRLAMALRSKETEEAKYLQASQLALVDQRYSGQLAIIKATIEEREEEVAFIRDLLARAEILSPMDGVAIFEDKGELVGRPLRTGEVIMTVAGLNDSKLVVYLATEDAIALDRGADVTFFLNTDPDRTVEAELVRASFTASPTPEGYLAYRLEARFLDDAESPRIGLRGVANVYGDRTTLFYYLLRKPLAAIRQWSGL